jgi:DNA mismatch endonuclease (patch repair protein)
MDTLSPPERSERMSRIRATHTRPELRVRKIVHGAGYRYRLHRRDLPGNPDLVFSGRRKVIFVHGCFWHRHPARRCKLARLPKTRLDFWLAKLEGNRNRDARARRRLRLLGWKALVVWECQLSAADKLQKRIINFLDE